MTLSGEFETLASFSQSYSERWADGRTFRADDQARSRLSPEVKRKFQAAAFASRKSVSEFVLDHALIRAKETLADRRRLDLDC